MKIEWDLKHLYIDDESWHSDYINLSNRVIQLQKLSEIFLKNAQKFLSYLKYKIEVDERIEKIYCYAKRHLDIDSTLNSYKLMLEQALTLYSDIQKINNDFENRIINNEKLVLQYLDQKELKYYQRYINLILRRKKHILKLDNCDYTITMNQIRQSYQNLFTNTIIFDNVIIDGERRIINRNNYQNLLLNEKQENRKIVYDIYTDAYAKATGIISKLYITKLKEDIKLSKQQKYKTLLSKRLYEIELSDKIVEEVIKKINENLSVMHKYTKLKKIALDLKKYHIYDSSLSICKIPKIEYPLEYALNIIKNALNVLGKDYIELITKMFDEGWIDVYPKDNKRTMSFSCISYVGVPYILVNYNDSINSVRTLAHEMGHAIHTFYSKNANNFEYFEFSYFLTEIASKVNEILVNEYMIENCHDKEEKIYIINSIISSLGNSLYGQVMLTEFEDNIINMLSKNKIVDENYLNDLYMKLSKKYNGKDFTYDDNIKYGWCKIPHFIMQDTYYLYQYSIGTAIATNIAYRILMNEENIVSKYKKFLSCGNSISIKEALKYLDIDLENGEYIDYSIELLSEKMDDMSKMLKM